MKSICICSIKTGLKLNGLFLIAIILLSLSLISCTIIEDAIYNITVGEDWEYDFQDGCDISSISDIMNILKEITPKEDEGDYWQTPEQTLERKTGDCEDYAILFMYLAYKYLNRNSSLIEIQYNGHEDAHAVVRMKDSGAWVDPTIQKYNQPEIFTSIDKLITYWNYGKTMWLSEKHKGISEWKF